MSGHDNYHSRRPGLVKMLKFISGLYSKFSDKITICIIMLSWMSRWGVYLCTFWIPYFGLVHFKIICQALDVCTGQILSKVPNGLAVQGSRSTCHLKLLFPSKNRIKVMSHAKCLITESSDTGDIQHLN
jgi:hypothetical protein